MCQVPRANARSPVRGDMGGSKWYKYVPNHDLFGGWGRVVVRTELHDQILFVLPRRGHYVLAVVGVMVWFGQYICCCSKHGSYRCRGIEVLWLCSVVCTWLGRVS